MSLREKIDANQKILVPVCVLAMFTGIGVIAYPYLVPMMHSAPLRSTKAYFYDLATNELIVAPIDSAPPTLRPEQTTGTPTCVRAFVFSCGDCADESTHFIGYLLKLSNEYKTKLDASSDDVRRTYRSPGPFDVSGLGLPRLEGLRTDESTSAWVRVAEGSPVKDVKPRWESIEGRPETRDFTQRLAKRCTSGRLRPCDPK